MTEQNNECNARDQASNVVLRNYSVSSTFAAIIDNHSRDLQASNCAKVAINPGKATRSRGKLLKLSKIQRQKREA